MSSVVLSPTSATLEIGETVELSAEPRAGDDSPLSRPVTWATSDASIAMVSESGLVTAIGEGGAMITATSEGVEATATIEVEPPPPPPGSGGWGVLGDSNSDEYRADDGRGGAYSATTFNWVEILVAARGLDFGSWGTRSEPRRTGYAYNWARSGARAATLLSSRQHTGLAAQIASGAVSNVVVYIGINDFKERSGRYGEIYSGAIFGQALQEKLDRFVSDVTTAVDALLAAGSPRVILLTVLDPRVNPSEYPDPLLRKRVTDAVSEVNAGLTAMANVRGIVIADQAVASTAMLLRADQDGFLHVGGELIDLSGAGDEPHNATLADTHPGTVTSGLMSNHLVLDWFNDAYGLGIPLLSDQEILDIAGTP